MFIVEGDTQYVYPVHVKYDEYKFLIEPYFLM